MSDEKLIEILGCLFIKQTIDREIKKCKMPCNICKKEFLSQPYENPKRWYLHRYSTSKGCEIYWKGMYSESENKNDAIKETFERACIWRTELNKSRKNKKNLWLIAEEK